MSKIKTTINIDEDLWKKFSHIVIEEKGYRKKNVVIEELIRQYIEKKNAKKEKKIRSAVILAAGIGSRLRPLTNNVPKCLLKINTETILEHQIENLKKCGIDNITIVAGYKADKIEKFCKDRSWDVNLIINRQYSTTNNLFSLWLAKEYLKQGFVCLNSDIVFDAEILEILLKSEGNICLVIDKKECTEEDMKVKVENGLIRTISKRMSREDVYGEFIGLSKFSAEGAEIFFNVLSSMPVELREKGFVAQGIQKLIDEGHKVFMVEVQGKFWADIDFVEDLNEVCAYLLNNRLK
ncbi:MAG: phosphocholine cytidylyltransferase family protein [Thermoplasmata archaeon]|nr:MAG: phosphocholine cytidylyltransferase family protein [Thermoplasmata archaeon]